jgi:hypothetical protein
MNLLEATLAEKVILVLLVIGFGIVLAVQIRPAWRHRLRSLSLLLPLSPYRLFINARRPVRLFVCRSTDQSGSAPDWRELPLRLPRTWTSWVWNPELQVTPTVYEYANFLADKTKTSGQKPESIRLAHDVVATYVAQQVRPPGGNESFLPWRLVSSPAGDDQGQVLYEASEYRSTDANSPPA